MVVLQTTITLLILRVHTYGYRDLFLKLCPLRIFQQKERKEKNRDFFSKAHTRIPPINLQGIENSLCRIDSECIINRVGVADIWKDSVENVPMIEDYVAKMLVGLARGDKVRWRR